MRALWSSSIVFAVKLESFFFNDVFRLTFMRGSCHVKKWILETEMDFENSDNVRM